MPRWSHRTRCPSTARADARWWRRRRSHCSPCRSIVMIVVQWQPRWYPLLDQAMIELLVRDVATSDSPTTGLVGRFLVDGAQASHPGPLSWYLLWPWHRLFGGSASGLIVGTVVTNLLAVGVLAWMIARRRRLELRAGRRAGRRRRGSRLRDHRAERGLEPAPSGAVVAGGRVRHVVRPGRRPSDAPDRRVRRLALRPDAHLVRRARRVAPGVGAGGDGAGRRSARRPRGGTT